MAPKPPGRALTRGLSWSRSHRLTAVAGILGAAAVLPASLRLFTPWFDLDLASNPQPASSYEEAIEQASAMLDEPPEVNRICASQILGHGHRTGRAVVLLHGYTNCPAQFRQIAAAYFAAGNNVVSLRLPAHGLRDRMTTAMTDLYPSDLTGSADRATDIAAGLGERVTVVGLSAGGTLAAWLAAQRDDVTEAVLIAPLMVPKMLPNITVAPVARAARYLPDFYIWWNSELKAELNSPPYAYPRFSIRSMGALLAIGRHAQTHLARTVRLERLVIITTDEDAAVSKPGVYAMADKLAPLTDEIVDINFPSEDGYTHDLVDPTGDNRENIIDIYRRIGPAMGIPQLAETVDPGVL